jgi:hypothetical protein
MKKSVIAVAIMGAMLHLSLDAQAQLYIQPHVGYGFAIAQTDEGTSVVSKKNSLTAAETRTATVIKSTGSTGINVGLDIGYKLSDYVGIQLGGTYLLENKRDVSNIDSTATTIGTYSLQSSTTANDRQIRLTPSVVLTTGGKVAPYLRLGAIIPVVAETDFSKSFATKNAVYVEQNIEQTEKVTYSPTVGFSAALGGVFALSNKSAVFIEADFNSLSLISKQGSLTSYKKIDAFKPPTGSGAFSNTTNLNDLKTADRETNYVDKIDDNSNIPNGANSYNKDKATDVLARKYNHTTLNGRLGFRISF